MKIDLIELSSVKVSQYSMQEYKYRPNVVFVSAIKGLSGKKLQ